jgi:hypothetical protein
MTYRIVKREGTMRKRIILLVALILFMAGMGNLYAYTYTYNNKTSYLIKVIVEFYHGEDRTNLIKPNGFYSFSTDFLLKSWKAEAFLDNQWQQILHLTCDFLPGNHSFSIHVNETRDLGGTATRNWYSTNP